jgi:actin-related protein
MGAAEGPSVIGDEPTVDHRVGDKYKIGSPALFYRRDGMALQSPMVDGLVCDWDVAEALWHYSFNDMLHVNPAEHPVIAAEPSFNTRANR